MGLQLIKGERTSSAKPTDEDIDAYIEYLKVIDGYHLSDEERSKLATFKPGDEAELDAELADKCAAAGLCEILPKQLQ